MHKKLQPYSIEIERQMLSYYKSLPERQRRQYAAIESEKLGYGGKIYIKSLFSIGQNTLSRGIAELSEKSNSLCHLRQRKSGGGRKKKRILS